jgi:predicted TIM-barrel fold metal-dependent hydrolase
MTTLRDRRRFLQQAAAALAAVTPAVLAGRQPVPAAEPKEATGLPIIDTHQHLWDLDTFRLRWIKQGSPLDRSFLTTDYLKATAGLNVIKSVYMEVDVVPGQQKDEAEYVIDICAKGNTPMVAAVISGRPASDGFKKYITPLAASKYIKGVRQVLHNPDNPAGFCLKDEFIKSIRLLGDLNLSFDLCLRPGELLDGAKLIDACPDTRFILDHCGNANVQKDTTQWQRDIAEVAKRKKVVCKVSGIVASAKPGHWSPDDLAPIINHTLDVFGPDRVMFGGDWPVCTLAATYTQWVGALKAIVRGRKEEEQRKLFHDNALRVYGLK